MCKFLQFFRATSFGAFSKFITLLYGGKFHFDLPHTVYDVETSENLF